MKPLVHSLSSVLLRISRQYIERHNSKSIKMFLVYVVMVLVSLPILKIYLNFKKKYRYWQEKGVKIIQPIFPFGNILQLFTKKTGITPCIFEWYNALDEKVIGLYAIDDPILLVKDPDIIKNILVKDFTYFTDRGVYIDKREPTAGHLWKLPGPKWKPLRTQMSPCFSIGKLKMMFPHLVEVGQEMENNLKEECKKNKAVNVDKLCQCFTVDVIASSIFGVETNSFADKENQYLLMEEELTRSDSRIRMIKASLQIIVPNFFNIFSFIQFETVKQSVLHFVSQMVRTVIEFREKTGTVRNDMMQLLIQLKNCGKVTEDDEKEFLTDGSETCLTINEVVAQAYTYFFVGSETSSSALVMLLYECALNKEIQYHLQNDINQVLSITDGKITYESILDMKYLNMVIAETLRKYPPLGFLQRKAVQNYTIPDLNLEIEKGTRLYFSVQGIHRDPKYYPDPEKFDPERFSKENQSKRHPCVYLAFGEGQRNCIGKRLGYLMLAVGTINIFRKFSVSLCDKKVVPEINPLAYTIKLTNPLVLEFSER